MMDLYESIYVDEDNIAYINITQKTLHVNKKVYSLDLIVTKIFRINGDKVILGSEWGIVEYNTNSHRITIINEFKVENFRSNDGVYINGKYYLGYMSKNYDNILNYNDNLGFIVEFDNTATVIENNVGIPNFMGVYEEEIIYVDSSSKTLNKLGGNQIMHFEDVIDGGFQQENKVYLCCYDSNKIIKYDLKTSETTKVIETTKVPTSCVYNSGILYYTSSCGLNQIEKEI